MTRIIAVIVGLLLVSANAYAADSPFYGTWKLNLAKSHMTNPRQAANDDHGSGSPYSRLTVFAPYGDDGVTRVSIGDENPNVSGSIEYLSAKFDGKDYAINGGDPRIVVLTRVDRSTINMVTKRHGKVTRHAQMKVSPDGKTLTDTSSGENAVGAPYSGQVEVFDRLE